MNIEGELTATESRRQIRAAITAWRQSFSQGAESLHAGLGGGTYWHPHLGVWGHFRRRARRDGSPRYWNAFGMSPRRLRRNIVVEINPPPAFRYGNMQGVIATDSAGTRYLLHKGQLRIPNRHISAEDFARVTSYESHSVHYSDDHIVNCYAVANIDAASDELQRQVALFVGECERIRRHYGAGRRDPKGDSRAEEAEKNSPELTGTYYVGPQDPKTVERRHGNVWHALTAALDKLGSKHTNQRVAGWGPDLRTFDSSLPLLFEIKSRLTASELQCAVGQLFIYEKLLGKRYKKVLVLPKSLSPELAQAVRQLKLEVLTYREHGEAVNIDTRKLHELIE